MFSLLLFSTVGLAATLPSKYHPLVIVGPFMGQNLEVMNESPFTVCNTKGKYEHLWINVEGVQDFYCIVQGLKLGGWDTVNKVSKPKDNIKVRPFGYAGSTKNQLDGVAKFGGAEYPIVAKLKDVGFVLDESLFGHTYDWRLGVRDWEQQYYPVFKSTIETAYRKNNGSPVVLTGISMAGQYTHAFLSWAKRTFGPAWAKQYIHAFAPVAAGWNGAVMGLSAGIDSILGTWRTDGLCPNCDPPLVMPSLFNYVEERRRADGLKDWVKTEGEALAKNAERRRMAGLQNWMKAEAAALGDSLLQDVFASFPALYLVSPGLDFSTNPPTDAEVLTIRNAEAPEACYKNPETATVCGAKEDAAGYNFEEGFLGKDQCGECYWTNGQCPEGFDRAHDGWTSDLCCKRHQCKSRTYHATEIPELLRELGQEEHAQMYEYSLTIDTTSDPGVPIHCIYSNNVQTFNQLSLSQNRDAAKADVEANVFTMDDGDQTVDHKSLEVCDRWSSTVRSYRVNGVAHSSLMSVEQVMDLIISIATEDQAHIDSWKDLDYTEVRPPTVTVDSTVLLHRNVCAICDTPAQLKPDTEYLDPKTNKMTKCGDADAFCVKYDCADAAEVREFFKENTQCCSRASEYAFNPTFWKLQQHAE